MEIANRSGKSATNKAVEQRASEREEKKINEGCTARTLLVLKTTPVTIRSRTNI